MSLSLVEFARGFVAGKISVASFSDQFIGRWKVERDNRTHRGDSARVSECLSSIFCVADMFAETPEQDYELNKSQLWGGSYKNTARIWGRVAMQVYTARKS